MIRRTLGLGLLGLCLLASGTPARASSYPATAPTPGALYRDGQTGRYLLGAAWLYRADPSDTGLSSGWWRDIADPTGWSPVTVPNAFNAGDFSAASMNGSVGWYRRDFVAPAAAFGRSVPRSQRRWIVRFESASYIATVWLNGHRIGSHTGAYLPFEFDLGTLRAGVNHLVVRVDDRRTPADLPPGPGGGWWNFGGLLREVYLRSVQGADIAQVRIRTLVPCPGCDATIAETVNVRNVTTRTLTVALLGRYGRLALDFGRSRVRAGRTWTATATAVLPRPDLWSIDHPHLYRATLTLSDAKGRRLGGYVTYSGVRTITVTSGGRLELNGRLLDLRGVNLHEQDPAEGAALDPSRLRRLFSEAVAVGATIIRAHYPLNPQLAELADREGVLLWSEVPVYQVNDAYLSQPDWLARAHAFLADDIRANVNHPSILVWSIGNELDPTPPPAETAYIAGAAALAHALDPTRPVGMAVSSWPGLPCLGAYAPLDVIGFNDYFGWYDAGGGSTDDRDALGPFLDSFRACYPRKALFVTELGFEGNRNGPVEERGTYQFQVNATAFHLGVFAARRWLSGALYFPLQDFAARPGWGGGDPWPDPPWVQKGFFDQYGNPKPARSLVSALFHAIRQIGPPPHRSVRPRSAAGAPR